jgi:uncharacterized membrane protein
MIAYVVQHNESFLWNHDHPVWHHYQPFKWYLLPHGLAGACAILLGPLQFSDRLRQRYTKFHRVIGRIYIFGALVAAPLGAYIQYFEERTGGARSFSIAALVDAVLLMLTTAIAFGFILNGKVQQHRQWMTRSFACALIFLEARVILVTFQVPEAAVEMVVWGCVAAAFPLADLVLQIDESLRQKARTVRAAA